MAHTIRVLVGGLMLLARCLLIGRLIARSAPAIGLANAAKVFIPHWFVAAGINMWIGVSKAGYSVAGSSFFHRCVCRASRGGTLGVVVVVAPLSGVACC